MDEFHGNYRIKVLDVIGRGSFGYVEKIELFNISGHKCGNYARKVFSPKNRETLDQYEIEEYKRRFIREVEYQASFVHKNIANIYIYNLWVENPWFIMNLAEGDLQHQISSKNLTTLEKTKIALMVLNGIKHLHSVDYVHRDIKPSNVLKFGNGLYKVSDFGLVKNLDQESESEVLTKIAALMGSGKYRAPEVFAGRYSKQTDIYALGILLEELELFEVNGMQKVIKKSTERRPFDRYVEVGDMLADAIEAIEEYKK